MHGHSFIVTTSWDDGHPADLRLVELLSKHHIAATFYVPCRNCEGRDVMDMRDVRSIAKVFEIGAHTIDHVDLTKVSSIEAKHQIESGKARLEDALGTPVLGFCYPRGGHTRSIRNLTQKAGFLYARTTANLHLNAGSNRFALPTTLQFFPHSRSTYLRNFISGGAYRTRVVPFFSAVAVERIGDRVKRLADFCVAQGTYFHLWGHSWEIEENGLWGELEAALCYISSIAHEQATNLEVTRRLISDS